MKRKLPVMIALLVSVAAAVAYFMDLLLSTDPVTGLVENGPVWLRYALMLVPVAVCCVTTFMLGPRAISVLRTRSEALCNIFVVAGVSGALYGLAYAVVSMLPFSVFGLLWAALYVWYGIWMILAAIQLSRQKTPSPTKSAFPGMMAAVPFCVLAITRVLSKPASLYRTIPLVRIVAILCAMLWLGMLLRGMYIALVRSRSRWMYLFGQLCFLFCLLEMVQTVYTVMLGQGRLIDVMEALMMFTLGLAAEGVSLAAAGRGTAENPITRTLRGTSEL